MATRPITFLSDYGYEDEFAGVCRGVIAGIAPGAAVIDLTHGIHPGDIRGGALALERALPLCPAGVHLAVVDIGSSPVRLEPVSATFHGRDLFAPVAARLSLGEPLEELGEPLDPLGLVQLELAPALIAAGHITASVLAADGFGNVTLNVLAEELPDPLEPGRAMALETSAGTVELPFGRAFSDVEPGSPLVFEDSSGRLALAVNRGNAAQALGLARDDEVVLRPR